jgi:hypothetical protein
MELVTSAAKEGPVSEEAGTAVFLRNERSERRAGRQSHATAIEVAPRDGARKAGTVIAERAAIPVRQPGTSRLQRRAVWLEVGLTAAAHILRNRRSREALTVGVIVLVALTPISWKVLARQRPDRLGQRAAGRPG